MGTVAMNIQCRLSATQAAEAPEAQSTIQQLPLTVLLKMSSLYSLGRRIAAEALTLPQKVGRARAARPARTSRKPSSLLGSYHHLRQCEDMHSGHSFCHELDRCCIRRFKSTQVHHSIPITRMTETIDRKKCTQHWLDQTGQWTGHDVAYSRKLLHEWMAAAAAEEKLSPNQQEKVYRQVTIWSTRIVERWLYERKQGNVHQDDNLLIEEGLHRVLHVWRRRLEHQGEEEARDKVIRLLNLFSEASVALKEPNLLPGDKAYSMVFAILARQPNIPGTCQLAETLMKQRCQQHLGEAPDLITWNSYLNVLSKCSLFEHEAPELAESVLFQDMTRMMILPDANSFASVLDAWAKSGRPEATERVQQLLKHTIQKKIVNTFLFNVGIDALGRSGNVEQAEALLREMMELHNNDPMLQVQPDVFSFLSAMKGWSKSGAKDAAERCTMLIKLMQQLHETGRSDLKLSIKFYNLLLETYAQIPDSGPKVENMLQELQEQYDQTGSELERPNLQSYAAAIRAWANTSSDEAPDRAHAIVKRLENLSKQGHHHLTPDTILYTSLIHALSSSERQDAPKRALSVLHHMQSLARDARCNVAPSTVTYNAVMNVLCKHQKFDSAKMLLDSMKDQVARYSGSPRPDFITYATIIHACARSSNSESGYLARQLIEEMEARADMGDASLQPSSSVYASVIHACKNIPGAEGAELAEDLLWKIAQRSQSGVANVVLDTVVCNAALRVWSESRAAVAPGRAEKLLNWMLEQANNLERRNVLPDIQSFNVVMDTWARSKRRISLQRIKSLMEDMQSIGLRPDVKSWNALLESMLRSNLTTRVSVGSAHEIFQKMMKLSKDFPECAPNTTTYNLMMGICCPQSDDASARGSSLETMYAVIVETCRSGHELMTPQTCLQTFHLLADFQKMGETIDSDIVELILQQYTRSNEIDRRIKDLLSLILDEPEVNRILAKHSA